LSKAKVNIDYSDLIKDENSCQQGLFSGVLFGGSRFIAIQGKQIYDISKIELLFF